MNSTIGAQNSSFSNILQNVTSGTTDSPWQGPVTIQAGHIILLVLFAVVILAGIFGNALVFVVYGGKELKGTVMASLLRILALVDQFTLLLFYTPVWIGYIFRKVPADISLSYCRLIFINAAAIFLSSWTLLAVSIDRVLCVCRPFLVKKPNFRRAMLGSLIPTFILMCVMCWARVVFTVRYSNGRCTFHESNIWGFISASLVTYLPGSGIIACNVILLVKLNCFRKSSVASTEAQLRQKQNMIMLLCLSILFVATTCLPLSQIFLLLGNTYESQFTASIVSVGIQAINNSANFYILCFTGSKFRSELKKLIPCSSNRVAPTVNQA